MRRPCLWASKPLTPPDSGTSDPRPDQPKSQRQPGRRRLWHWTLSLLLLATAGFCSSVRLEQREDELRLLRQALTSAYVQTAVELLEQQDRTDGLLKLFQAYQVTDDGDPATVPIRRMLSGWSRTLGPPLLHDDSIVAVAVSRNGRIAVTASHDNTARCWNLENGQPIGPAWEHEDDVVDVALSADGLLAVTACDDNLARLWNTATTTRQGKPLKHKGDVTAVAISADGSRVVTVSGPVARIWQTVDHQTVGAPLEHAQAIRDVAISSSGTLILTAWRRPRCAALERDHRETARGTLRGKPTKSWQSRSAQTKRLRSQAVWITQHGSGRLPREHLWAQP